MHSHLPLCIALHTYGGDTYVTCVLSTLIYIYVMSLGYAHVLLLPCFTPIQMSFISCTHAYFISIEYTILAWVI